MPIHHNFDKGTSIIIKLRNGDIIKDKYVDTKPSYLVTKNYRFKWKEIQFTAINKNK